MSLAEVTLWGETVGAVSWNDERGLASFEYAPEFIAGGIEPAPLVMPLAGGVRTFPALPRAAFHGLPSLLADSLPDRFGHALIDAWLAREGRAPESFNPVERLCYVGERGAGALEYHPALGPDASRADNIEVAALVELASDILSRRERLDGSFAPLRREEALQQILAVGASAGGARAKALIAWNPDTNEVRSGQSAAPAGFSHWILKFDGVAENDEQALGEPQGYGRIELAYYEMALAAGIDMSECRVLEEGGRAHFMTRRFDRTDSGEKIHKLSLCAMAHLDFMQPGAHSYEQALSAIRQLGLPAAAVEQQFRRMAFNIIARNQDDHTKNIAFLMDRDGRWSLSPAYDMTYSYNPQGPATRRHQMTLNGKSDNFTMGDFRACAKTASLILPRTEAIVAEVTKAVQNWKDFAANAKVPEAKADKIQQTHRTGLLG